MAITDKLTAIGDAIRGKTGKSDSLTLEQMVTEINGIESGGSIPENARLCYVGNAEGTADMANLICEASAVGNSLSA